MTLPSYSVEFLLVERRLFERRLLLKEAGSCEAERRKLQRRADPDTAHKLPGANAHQAVADRAAA